MTGGLLRVLAELRIGRGESVSALLREAVSRLQQHFPGLSNETECGRTWNLADGTAAKPRSRAGDAFDEGAVVTQAPEPAPAAAPVPPPAGYGSGDSSPRKKGKRRRSRSGAQAAGREHPHAEPFVPHPKAAAWCDNGATRGWELLNADSGRDAAEQIITERCVRIADRWGRGAAREGVDGATRGAPLQKVTLADRNDAISDRDDTIEQQDAARGKRQQESGVSPG
eukprot:gene47156-38244_t